MVNVPKKTLNRLLNLTNNNNRRLSSRRMRSNARRMNNMNINRNPMNQVKNSMVRRNYKFLAKRSNNILPTINYERPLTNSEIANQLNIQRATSITPVNANTIRSVREGEIVVANREFQGNINPGMNYYNFKPGYSGLKALDYQALGFDNYIVRSVIYEFRSNMSSATNGRVIMSFDYEGDPPTNVNELMASDRSKTTNVYKNTNYITKVASLMKQKLHAVDHGDSQSTSRDGTPTTCGTFTIFVDGLPPTETGTVGSIYCTYVVCLKNFHGIKASTTSKINQIVSQNVNSVGSPSPTPPIVVQEDNTIEPIEINANDSSANALVDGYQINQNPNVGDNFTVVTTPNGSNSQPTIRVRSSDGTVIPATYYRLTADPSAIVNSHLFTMAPLKQYNPDEIYEIEVGSFISLFFTTVTFIKTLADIISPVAKVILEVVKPYANPSENDEPMLLDQFSAVAKGTELEVTLPDSESTPLVDNINTFLTCVITVDGSSGTVVRNISRNSYNPDSMTINSYKFIAPTQTIDLTTSDQPFTDSDGKFALSFLIDNSDSTFKVGNLYQIQTLFSSVSNISLSGSFSIVIDPYQSPQVSPIPSPVNDIVKYFTIVGDSNPSTVGLQVNLDNDFITKYITAADVAAGTRRVSMTIQISEQVDIQRKQVIPNKPSALKYRLK